MMYIPKHFDERQRDLVHDLIRSYNFATMITIQDGFPIVSHLPFLFTHSEGEHGILTAHMARGNPQWRSFKNSEVTVIFQGPHAYISPRWYSPSDKNVPTWNYAVVHAYGVPKIISDETASYSVLQRLIESHDPSWTVELSDKDRRDMVQEIVVFEIEIKKLEAKFKLSQNRSIKDVEAVMKELSSSMNQIDNKVGQLMGKVVILE
jgi:transcriptional regulator